MVWFIVLSQTTNAQVYLKTSLIGRSKYDDTQTDNTNAKGSAYIVRGGFQLPISIKADTIVKGSDTIPSQTIWAVRADASFSQFNHRNMEAYDFPNQVENYRAGVIYLHTLNKKWSVYATLGAGLYTTSSNFSSNQIIGEGALIFIRTITPNLKVGVGIAFDNTFGYPMAYPGLIVDWAIDGRGGKYFARLNSNEIKAGVKYNEKFQLSLNLDAFGASALFKDKMFSHVYYTAGITPEFEIGKGFSIPITVGATLFRNMYSHNRNLTDFFSYMTRKNVQHFAPSPFVSIGITYGL